MLKKTIYQAGGALLLLGAALPLFSPHMAVWVFALGALLFGVVQMTERYGGDSFVVRRLYRQQKFGALLLLVSAALMFTSVYQIAPFRGGEWKITLCIAAVLEGYAIFRIYHEEKARR